MPYDPNLHLMCHPFEVQTVERMRRTWNRPDRVQPDPVLQPTEPWEGRFDVRWGSIVYDPKAQRFQMWYVAHLTDVAPPWSTVLCYATSADGVHWEKPELGLIEWNGSRANNIVWVMRDTGPWNTLVNPRVLVEPDAPAGERYKLITYARRPPEGGTAFFALTSPDGLRWTWHDRPFPIETGDRFHCVYDDRHAEYWLTSRRRRLVRDMHAEPPLPWIRTVSRWRSGNLRDWSAEEPLLTPDDRDLPETEFYSMYPMTAGNGYVGFIEVYDRFVERLHTELCISRDGTHWERPERRPWLDRGTDGAWDDMWVFPQNNDPIAVGDRMLVFFNGGGTGHGGKYEPKRPPMRPLRHEIGLAWFGRDRWAALTVGQDGGAFVSEPVEVAGPRLILNADAEFGDVRVELLDAHGGPIDGHRLDDADLIDTDGLDTVVTWGGSGQLSELSGRRVRLHVRAARASVYSFRFG